MSCQYAMAPTQWSDGERLTSEVRYSCVVRKFSSIVGQRQNDEMEDGERKEVGRKERFINFKVRLFDTPPTPQIIDNRLLGNAACQCGTLTLAQTRATLSGPLAFFD